MSNYSKNDIILVKYPFTDLSIFKVRPAIVINYDSSSVDLFITPLTSKCSELKPGEFILNNWKESGLNVQSAVKRGVFTIDEKLVVQFVGKLIEPDIELLNKSLIFWLGIK